MMNDRQFYMLMYAILVIVAGVGEYLHLTPMGTFAVVLGGVLGHGFGIIGNGASEKKNGGATP